MYLDDYLYKQDIEYLNNLKIDWKRLEDKGVLIIGATGMIGTVLVDALMERNIKRNSRIRVYAMGRIKKRAQERFADYLQRPEFTFLSGDINEGLDLNKRVDYIFYCASNTHPRAYAADPIGTILTNVLGTNNILKYAADKRCERVLFLSSVEIYGENLGTEAFRERDCGYIDCNTVRAGYPEGKRVGEALCQAYRAQYDLDIVIPRICRVYGPTMLESDSKALAQFIRNAVRRENIVLKSDGSQYFSYCYAADVVSALLYSLLYGENGEAYNIADEGSNICLKELAKLLADKSGVQIAFELPDAVEKQGFSKATKAVLDSGKIKELGWKPACSIQEGLDRTIDILRNAARI